MVRVGNYTSAMLILNTGTSQGCVLSSLLYSLFTYGCVAKHDSNTIINDETVYREEFRELAVWCQDNNLSLNVSKTKELIVDDRKRQAEQAPININGALVELVESFKFLTVHITNKLSWSKHKKTVVKRLRQNLFPLRRLKRFGMGSQILKKFYSCTIESILTGCITGWYDNCSASDRNAMQRIVHRTQ